MGATDVCEWLIHMPLTANGFILILRYFLCYLICSVHREQCWVLFMVHKDVFALSLFYYTKIGQ